MRVLEEATSQASITRHGEPRAILPSVARSIAPTFLMAPVSALVSGILLMLALPPFHHGWIAWFALVPLLAMRQRSSTMTLLGITSLTLLPSATALAKLFGLPAIGVAVAVGAVVGFSFLFGVAAAIALWLERLLPRSIARPFAFPCMTVAVEAFMQIMLPDLPVPSLAWSQTPGSIFIQSGMQIGSALPVTFLIVLTNVGIADAIGWVRHGSPGESHVSLPPLTTALATLLFVANAVFGIVQSSLPFDSAIPIAVHTNGEQP